MSRALVVALAALIYFGQGISTAAPPADVQLPDIAGDWAGEWGPFDPASATELDKEQCKALLCRVVVSGEVWQATFEGECGRPYKYTVTMEGRRAGDTVLFKGTTDLGEKDGGVYDWIGRATDSQFIGFYTSSHHTGTFRMKRNPSPAH